MDDKCKDCICLNCEYKPCEDCFKCDIDGIKINEKCPSFSE